MEISDYIQLVLYFTAISILAPFTGKYLAAVYGEERTLITRILNPVENLIYRLTALDGSKKMTWKEYACSLLILNFVGFVFLYIILITQKWLPLNPAKVDNMSWHLAFNAAVSFMTNTNWQSYAGETTVSHFSQMAGLTVQNFLSASTGLAVLLALIRGLSGEVTGRAGNFWKDIVRSVLYILLPLSILIALLLASQGVIQNFTNEIVAETLTGQVQEIPTGPVASQIAIKQLGTNGGGFFNANSSHPFENPTPFSNFLEMLSILLIPASLTFMFGRMTGSPGQGRIIFAVMMTLLVTALALSLYSEYNTRLPEGLAVNMEGKETRFGVTNSILWSVTTTAASNGSVNLMMDSLTPLAGIVSMTNIMLGEVIFGGVGAGMYGMIVFILLTVFISGLMIGRTPEYLGKKVEAFEVQMSILAIIIPSAIILLFSALAVSVPAGLAGITNPGPHGLSQILYAYSSAAGNNGSAFAGLAANTAFFNITTGIGMIAGRFGVILPVLAIAGRMAGKKTVKASAGTFRTDSVLFGILLIAVIVIVGGLTFFPAVSLSGLAEHFLAGSGLFF